MKFFRKMGKNTKLQIVKNLQINIQQLKTKNFTHIPTLSLQSDVTQEVAGKCLNLEFENRFQNFKKHHVLFWAFASPLAVEVNLLATRLQMEHCEMCCDTQLKENSNKLVWKKDKFLRFTNMLCRWFRYLETLMQHKPRIDARLSKMMGEY